MRLQKLSQDFTVCQLEKIELAHLTGDFWFLAKTDDEVSLICESAHTPADTIKTDAGWKAVRIEGKVEFTTIGVLANLTATLERVGVSIITVSTYDTDYIFMKAKNFDKGIKALEDNDYIVKDMI
jgi:hypothetical protein